MNLSYTKPADWPQLRTGSIADVLGLNCRRQTAPEATPDAQEAPIALLGLPDDTGVSLNHGRPGAAQGPTAFRATLARFGNPFDAATNSILTTRFVDCGDVVCSDHPDPETRLHENHDRTSQSIEALHNAGFITVGIGGGHDGTFAFARGLARSLQASDPNTRLAGLNLDPHLDVRETTGSGMPFRQLIEQDFLDPARFTELGIGRFSNSREHIEYLACRGSRLTTTDDLLANPVATIDSAFHHAFGTGTPGFVTIDLDALDGSYAPGVSAVNPMGVTPDIASAVAERAGETPGVRHFDIMELCPPHDDGRTARIAAMLFAYFLAGFRKRPRA
ncbi:MAG: formimidoylglutamase [Phycisphaerales bacterium JB050]